MRTDETAAGQELTADDDLAVIDDVVRGNREMFEVLVRRHNQRLFRVGIACLNRREWVEDAMQNAYLKAYLHLSRFERKAAFSTWLTRIMVNECRMMLRKQNASREDAWSDETHSSIPDPDTTSADHNLSLNEMKTALERAICELPPKYRRVYVLREVQQLSTAETAASLGTSVESVKVSLHRAREQLKARLLNSAASLELFAFHAPLCNRLTARVMTAILEVSSTTKRS